MLQLVDFFAGTMSAKSWNHSGEKLQAALPAMEMAGFSAATGRPKAGTMSAKSWNHGGKKFQAVLLVMKMEGSGATTGWLFC